MFFENIIFLIKSMYISTFSKSETLLQKAEFVFSLEIFYDYLI